MKSKHVGKDRNSNDAMAKLMEQYLDHQVAKEAGEHSFATIKDVTESQDYVFIETPSGPGLLSKEELLDKDLKLSVNPGQKIDVFFLRSDSGENYYGTSPVAPFVDEILESAYQNQVPMTGIIARKVKGGYEVKIGEAMAFCPDSQMTEENPSTGDEIFFMIRETGKRVICSNRQYRQMIRERQKERLQQSIAEGDVVEATVTQVKDFGVFVDLGGLDGLVPVSEISFKKIGHPSEVLKTGDQIRVKVLELDWKEDRLTLSYKALLKNPWQGELPFREGEIIEGSIENIKPFGMFVGIKDGFSGLVPNARSGVPRGQSLDKTYQPGQKVRVMVMTVDRENQKISLSITDVNEADARKDYEDYMKSDQDESRGEQISSFGKALLESLNKQKKN